MMRRTFAILLETLGLLALVIFLGLWGICYAALFEHGER